MKKEYLIIATVALAVLILVSSVPAMQSTSISEYQPICPKESYNKITELHEEGLSEEEIAEKLAFPLDIVTRYLEGNYTPPPCPESDQRMPLSDCSTYSKIKDLYGEGWSEEEIAETLELPLDTVNGFISGNYAIISSCPEPYQAKRKMDTGVFNITNNNSEQNQAQEKQDEFSSVPVSPKPDMSIPLKPTPTAWISVGPNNISIPHKLPPTEWWESLEAFKQESGISDDTIELVGSIADSLVVNESFKQASVQVSIPIVINSRKCEIVEIKRVLEDPIFLPSVNGSVYFPEREEVSVKIRRGEG